MAESGERRETESVIEDTATHTRPEPVVTRRELLGTALGASLLAGLDGMTSGTVSARETAETTASSPEFQQWTAYDTKLARYFYKYEMDDPFDSPPENFQNLPADAPVRETGYSATRTFTTLRYLGTSFSEYGNPSTESDEETNGAWRHTFALSSNAFGLSQLRVIPGSPPHVPVEPLYTFSGAVRREVNDEIVSRYLEGDPDRLKRFLAYYDRSSGEETTYAGLVGGLAPPEALDATGTPPNSRAVVGTELEVSSAGSDSVSARFSTDNVAVSARRDEDLFTFADGLQLVKSMFGAEGLELLQGLGPQRSTISRQRWRKRANRRRRWARRSRSTRRVRNSAARPC